MINEFMKDGQIYAKLCKALKQIPTFPKGSTAGTGSFAYKYTDLDTIVSKVVPILSDNGLGYVQSLGLTTDGKPTICTKVFSENGEWIQDETILPEINAKSVNAAQALGMSITYMRRYCLCSMLGITSDQDVDANTFDGAIGKENKDTQKKPQSNTSGNKSQSDKGSSNGSSNTKPRMTAEQGAKVKELLTEYGVFSEDEQKEWRTKWATHKEWTAEQFIKMLDGVIDGRVAAEVQ